MIKIIPISKIDYFELAPEDNIFYSVVADITHRCNMECANCYIPNRNILDMDADRLIECISRFPKRSEIRLIGAEPTVRKDIDKIISRIRETGHRPVMMTNGLKLANYDYAKKLYDAGLKTINISMNGADNDDIYAITDELRCAKRKMKALKNCADIGYFININCIIMKGVNEMVIPRLLEIVKDLGSNSVIRFRNVGQIGRYTLEHNQNYSFDELIDLVSASTGKSIDYIKQHNTVNGYEEKNNVLFPLNPVDKFKSVWVKITNWSPEGDIPDPGSRRRGRITENFKVAPFFEHVKLNEFKY